MAGGHEYPQRRIEGARLAGAEWGRIKGMATGLRDNINLVRSTSEPTKIAVADSVSRLVSGIARRDGAAYLVAHMAALPERLRLDMLPVLEANYGISYEKALTIQSGRNGLHHSPSFIRSRGDRPFTATVPGFARVEMSREGDTVKADLIPLRDIAYWVFPSKQFANLSLNYVAYPIRALEVIASSERPVESKFWLSSSEDAPFDKEVMRHPTVVASIKNKLAKTIDEYRPVQSAFLWMQNRRNPFFMDDALIASVFTYLKSNLSQERYSELAEQMKPVFRVGSEDHLVRNMHIKNEVLLPALARISSDRQHQTKDRMG